MKDYAAADRAKLIAGVEAQPVTHASRVGPIDLARARFGKTFAADKDSTWKPNKTPFLTRWQAGQVLSKRADGFAA